MTDQAPPNSSQPNRDESNQQSMGSRETIAPSGLELDPKNSGPFPALPVTFGRFEVRKHLGKGAMGTVYLAFDPELNKPEISNQVAIKIPLLQTSDDSTLLERFCREAQATGAMNHPNICKLYEVGEIAGTHYISMEYIDGRPLADYIGQDQQPQLPRQVAGIIRKLAQGLAHAHERGFIHRDLKPTNVMIATNGQPKIMDFGLARRFGVTGDIRLTQSNTIVGSPAYMSPEQARSENDTLTPASDIYSLGTLFFESVGLAECFVSHTLLEYIDQAPRIHHVHQEGWHSMACQYVAFCIFHLRCAFAIDLNSLVFLQSFSIRAGQQQQAQIEGISEKESAVRRRYDRCNAQFFQGIRSLLTR